jgi:YHS domain-containing protein
MYVAENLAVQSQVAGTTIYFCSEECQNNYVSELKNRRQPDQQPV